MGFLQGAASKPGSSCPAEKRVINIQPGSAVTIEDLNIRNGCAKGRRHHINDGTLHLKRSTVYDN